MTCVEYHPFENLIAICGLGGRTVSVCLYRHSDLMYGDTDVLQNEQTTGVQRFNWIQNAPEISSNTVKNVDILKVTPSTSSHRRPVLQKSITVDHSSSSSHHHPRSPHGHSHPHDQQHQHKHPHHNEESEESTERSRMKRAIRKLETALKMRSLDHS